MTIVSSRLSSIQQLLDLLRRDRVERASRLVEQEHFGLVGERARDAEPLLLPAGEASALCRSRSFTSSHSAARRSDALDDLVELRRASRPPLMRGP